MGRVNDLIKKLSEQERRLRSLGYESFASNCEEAISLIKAQNEALQIAEKAITPYARRTAYGMPNREADLLQEIKDLLR